MHFNKGDLVKVVMTCNDVFKWQTAPSFDAEIIHTPYDVGDLWQFRVELPNKQLVHLAINPLSSEFVGMAEYVRVSDMPSILQI